MTTIESKQIKRLNTMTTLEQVTTHDLAHNLMQALYSLAEVSDNIKARLPYCKGLYNKGLYNDLLDYASKQGW